MFDRFTDRARRTMVLARKEVLKMHHDCIGTEHLLLGLILEGTGIAAKVMKSLGVDIDKTRHEIEKRSEPRDTTRPNRREIPFTPPAKSVLEHAVEEANKLSHEWIGTEHILLGLIRESDSPAAQVLRDCSLSEEVIRDEILNQLGIDPKWKANALDPGGETDRGAKAQQERDDFVLLDDDDNVRARIGLTRDKQPSVSLYDKNKVERAVLRLEADGSPVFELKDKDGHVLFRAP